MALDAADIQPPNVRFKYSNIAYGLLGQVIEAATGTTYHEHVTREVVDRLGLTNTGPELDPARAGELAVGYSSLAYASTACGSSTWTPGRWRRPPASTAPPRTSFTMRRHTFR